MLIAYPEEYFTMQYQGSEEDRYNIYVANATELGWAIKTFDEWLNS